LTYISYFTLESELQITSDMFTQKNIHINIHSTTLKMICVKNDQIIKLDVSKCTKLEKLVCSGNNIKDLSINDQLLTLLCSDNRLTKLLLNRSLIELYCCNNKIKRLKLNADLKVLHCSRNLLTDIVLNKKLEILLCNYNYLTTIETNKELKFLSCKNNLITKLKLNQHISTLYCKHNQLTSLIVNKHIYNQLKKYKRQPFVTLPNNIPIFLGPKAVSNDYQCSICLEEHAEDLIITDCKHVFHIQCIILIKGYSCPYCRHPIWQLM